MVKGGKECMSEIYEMKAKGRQEKGCLCVCVSERGREREKERKKQRGRERERKRVDFIEW